MTQSSVSSRDGLRTRKSSVGQVVEVRSSVEVENARSEPGCGEAAAPASQRRVAKQRDGGSSFRDSELSS